VLASAQLDDAGRLALLPAWLIGSTVFWLWVPRFLLHRKIQLRALLPGALLATVMIGGTVAASPFFLAAPMNEYGTMFGSFGVVVTFVAYAFVMITMSLMCAVFSPVWADWRQTEKLRRDESHDEPSLPPKGRDVVSESG
jgi:uncharacterized BrkB/YihY/UPF0761 family membrane protein